MGRMGFTELLVILAIVLLLFGPKKLPELARSLGQAMKEFKKGQEEIENTFTGNTTTTNKQEVYKAEETKPAEDETKVQ